jgi:hypothetical protein
MVGTAQERLCPPYKFEFFNPRQLLCAGDGELFCMDMSLVSAAMATQAGDTQMQIAATIMKNNADAEKSAVLTLLGQQSPQADLAAGVGGNLDISV